MDDLNLLQGLRADAPEPDAARLAALRDRLTAVTTATLTTAATSSTKTGTTETATTPERRRLWRRLWRPLAARVLLAGTLAAGLAIAPTFIRSADQNRPVPPAHSTRPGSIQLLEQAALVAERRPFRKPRPDQWVYTKTKDVQPADGRTTIYEQWMRFDGKQAASIGEDGELHVSDLPQLDPGDDDLTPQQYYDKLVALPIDPYKLLAHVAGDKHWLKPLMEDGVPVPRGTPVPRDAQAFRVLTLYLDQGAVMPPKLEATIYRALAKIPAVKVEVGVLDADGRPGIGLYYEPKGQEITTRYFVLDSQTYRLLGDRMVWNRDQYLGDNPEPAFRKGSVGLTATLAGGVVDRPGQIP
ncbi:CU044_5270 family protein [Nonomuraea sp. CA-143628]|uniref:CU044_5270 family protein n=1 Tax=Nonomuraea sp. CA-143628 TaxID=3239997 RepID=UPI003D94AF5D